MKTASNSHRIFFFNSIKHVCQTGSSFGNGSISRFYEIKREKRSCSVPFLEHKKQSSIELGFLSRWPTIRSTLDVRRVMIGNCIRNATQRCRSFFFCRNLIRWFPGGMLLLLVIPRISSLASSFGIGGAAVSFGLWLCCCFICADWIWLDFSVSSDWNFMEVAVEIQLNLAMIRIAQKYSFNAKGRVNTCVTRAGLEQDSSVNRWLTRVTLSFSFFFALT